MKNKFLLGLLALSTLGLANSFEAKLEGDKGVKFEDKVQLNDKSEPTSVKLEANPQAFGAVQKNKLDITLNDTLSLTAKIEHNFASFTGDSGLAVKADFKEAGALELTTFLAPKASLQYTYKTDLAGLNLEAFAKYTEESKFTKNALEAGLKGKKVFSTNLNVTGKAKLQYVNGENEVKFLGKAIKVDNKEIMSLQTLLPELGVEAEYKPISNLTLNTDLVAKSPIYIAKHLKEMKEDKPVYENSTFAYLDILSKNKVSYDAMLSESLKVTPQAELNYNLNAFFVEQLKAAPNPKNDMETVTKLVHKLNMIPAIATEYKMGAVTLNAKVAVDVELANYAGSVLKEKKDEKGKYDVESTLKFGLTSVTPKFEAGLKYTW